MNKKESDNVIRFRLDLKTYLSVLNYCKKKKICFKDFVSFAIDEFTGDKKTGKAVQ